MVAKVVISVSQSGNATPVIHDIASRQYMINQVMIAGEVRSLTCAEQSSDHSTHTSSHYTLNSQASLSSAKLQNDGCVSLMHIMIAKFVSLMYLRKILKCIF